MPGVQADLVPLVGHAADGLGPVRHLLAHQKKRGLYAPLGQAVQKGVGGARPGAGVKGQGHIAPVGRAADGLTRLDGRGRYGPDRRHRQGQSPAQPKPACPPRSHLPRPPPIIPYSLCAAAGPLDPEGDHAAGDGGHDGPGDEHADQQGGQGFPNGDAEDRRHQRPRPGACAGEGDGD